MYTEQELAGKKVKELREIAEELEVEGFKKLTKSELIEQILEADEADEAEFEEDELGDDDDEEFGDDGDDFTDDDFDDEDGEEDEEEGEAVDVIEIDGEEIEVTEEGLAPLKKAQLTQVAEEYGVDVAKKKKAQVIEEILDAAYADDPEDDDEPEDAEEPEDADDSEEPEDDDEGDEEDGDDEEPEGDDEGDEEDGDDEEPEGDDEGDEEDGDDEEDDDVVVVDSEALGREIELTEDALGELKKGELVKLAEELEIEVENWAKKSEIIEAILEAESELAEEAEPEEDEDEGDDGADDTDEPEEEDENQGSGRTSGNPKFPLYGGTSPKKMIEDYKKLIEEDAFEPEDFKSMNAQQLYAYNKAKWNIGWTRTKDWYQRKLDSLGIEYPDSASRGDLQEILEDAGEKISDFYRITEMREIAIKGPEALEFEKPKKGANAKGNKGKGGKGKGGKRNKK